MKTGEESYETTPCTRGATRKRWAQAEVTEGFWGGESGARYKKDKAGLKDSSHRQMNFEAAKGMIEQKVRAGAGEKRMREWERQLKKNALIEIVEQKQKHG